MSWNFQIHLEVPQNLRVQCKLLLDLRINDFRSGIIRLAGFVRKHVIKVFVHSSGNPSHRLIWCTKIEKGYFIVVLSGMLLWLLLERRIISQIGVQFLTAGRMMVIKPCLFNSGVILFSSFKAFQKLTLLFIMRAQSYERMFSASACGKFYWTKRLSIEPFNVLQTALQNKINTLKDTVVPNETS